jgi:hypothetical protein
LLGANIYPFKTDSVTFIQMEGACRIRYDIEAKARDIAHDYISSNKWANIKITFNFFRLTKYW